MRMTPTSTDTFSCQNTSLRRWLVVVSWQRPSGDPSEYSSLEDGLTTRCTNQNHLFYSSDAHKALTPTLACSHKVTHSTNSNYWLWRNELCATISKTLLTEKVSVHACGRSLDVKVKKSILGSKTYATTLNWSESRIPYLYYK